MPGKGPCIKPLTTPAPYVCPCINCKRRAVGCHSNCTDYISWSNDYAEKKMKIRKAKYNQELSENFLRQSGYEKKLKKWKTEKRRGKSK